MTAERSASASLPQSPPTLPEYLAHWAAARGRAVAIRHKSHGVWVAWTWSDLQAEVGRVAAALAAAGFGVGDLVALATGPSPEALAVALAAQGLGGAAIWVEGNEDEARGNESSAKELGSPTLPAARFGFAHDEAGLAELRARLGLGEPWELGLFIAEHGAPPDDPSSAVRAYAKAVAGRGQPAIAAPLWAQPSDAAFHVAERARSLTHAGLILAARAWLEANDVRAGQRAFTGEGPATEATVTFIAAWLVGGMSLILPEDATTADTDRREAQPTVVAATAAAYDRLSQRVSDNLPAPGTWLGRVIGPALSSAAQARARGAGPRSLVSRLLRGIARWLVLRPLRNVLGFRRAALALVLGAEAPSAPARELFVQLGIPLRALPLASIADAFASSPRLSSPPTDRSTLFEPVLVLSTSPPASVGKLT